ncbi:putative ABC transporter ATP-binding protein YxlF [Clostridium tepidiprofundi DSM 19306]|uniref:Putative ABC transporter ATP-binding protein YxlF n=1 Tax=Clostridium tepidiprofundi DSM 19306 TaxID=1121338 RepID=A0A151ASE3_9CLOT|nr:ABC transporter ATP-binding protein [Clostridium tepidiprofundi]KYH30546.1 putative ABC transporter ATP-binding protein YxlF [Clostridium tepidiprofundi DSM 19306]
MEEIIKINKVSKSFNGMEILKDISLSINKGSTVGIIGENGSGKSVIFKLICGFVKPDSGEIYIRGEKLGEKFDFPDNVGALINKPGYIDMYTGFKNLKFLAGIRNKIDDDKIKSTMKLVGLDSNNRTKVKHYSLGMKQKLGIAQAIMEDQDIIILDEPFNALDFRTNNDIKKLIKRLKDKGNTILLTSHNHSDIEELCDEIYIIYNGKIEKLTDDIKKKYFE